MDEFKSYFTHQKREIAKLARAGKRQKAREKITQLEGRLHQEILANHTRIPIKVFKRYLKNLEKMRNASFHF